MPVAVQPETILKDLAKLWVDLAKQDAPSGTGVLRACAMTLIVAAAKEEDPQGFGETIAELMREHPGRVIILRTGNVNGSTLESRVFAQCWKPFGRNQQICCEEVEITACPSRFADVPKLVLGITVPDLPVVLWLRNVPADAQPGAEELFTLADKIIVDSSRCADPEKGLAYVRELQHGNRNVADLEWTRLTPWRESVAHIFEDERNLRFLKSIQRVQISHVGEVPPVSARYLASWLRHTLASSVELSFQAVPVEPGPRIRGIVLTGPEFSASVALEGSSAVLNINQLTRRTAFPGCDNHILLREELSILGRDPIFRRCLE